VSTPFGEAHLPHLPHVQLPQVQLPHVRTPPLPELGPALERLTQASSLPQQQMLRMCEMFSHFQEELGHSAKLMFDEVDDAWDESLKQEAGKAEASE
jgi:hypothetical protein